MLTVEDGTGLSDADSYVSLGEADAYFALYPNIDWGGTYEEKEVALRTATRDLDLIYGAEYIGNASTLTQALAFPRDGEDEVPTRIKRATMELAAISMTGFSAIDIDDDSANDSSATEFSFKLEGVYSETVKYASGRNAQPQLNRVRLILGTLLQPISSDRSFVLLTVMRG